MKNNKLLSTLLDIAAMKLDFPVTDEDLVKMAEEIDAIPNEHWYWCTFRESYLICLYGNEDVNDKNNMDWLPYTKNCKTLKELCNNFIFPMTDIRPRIIIIRTMPGMKMRHHTDCYAHQMQEFEPKLRLVLKGRENNPLYYIDDKDNRVPIPNDWRAYLMSGAAIHGMENNGDEKYTLCWGDPWVGDNLQNTNFLRYITEQINKHESTSIKISLLGNVNHYAGIKDPKVECIYSWNDWQDIQTNKRI